MTLMRIDDVPVIDLTKVEFLEKLGEGKSFNLIIYLGAFGKVRLCKIKKSNIDSATVNMSAPVKSMSSITLAKTAGGKDDKENASASKASNSSDDEV